MISAGSGGRLQGHRFKAPVDDKEFRKSILEKAASAQNDLVNIYGYTRENMRVTVVTPLGEQIYPIPGGM